MSTVQIRSDVRANPLSTVLAGEVDFVRCQYTDSLDHTGLCTLELSPEAPFLPLATQGNILRITEDGGTVLEYRIDRVGQSLTNPTIEVVARPVIHDLNRVFLWQSVGGVPSFTLGATDLLASEWIDAYVLPALVAAGYGYIDRGTTDLDRALSLEWSMQSALWLLNQLLVGTDRDLVYRIETPGAAVERYVLEIVPRGAALPSPRVIVGHNASELDWVTDNEAQANVLIPLGAVPAGGVEPSTIGQYVARVVSVDGNALTLDDPDGNPAPVYATDQVTGQYLELLVPPIESGARS